MGYMKVPDVFFYGKMHFFYKQDKLYKNKPNFLYEITSNKFLIIILYTLDEIESKIWRNNVIYSFYHFNKCTYTRIIFFFEFSINMSSASCAHLASYSCHFDAKTSCAIIIVNFVALLLIRDKWRYRILIITKHFHIKQFDYLYWYV